MRKQTHDTAQLFGLGDRGTIEVGKKADINVIDMDALTLHTRGWRTTCPPAAGAWCRAQRATTPRSSAAWSPGGTARTPAPGPAGWSRGPLSA